MVKVIKKVSVEIQFLNGTKLTWPDMAPSIAAQMMKDWEKGEKKFAHIQGQDGERLFPYSSICIMSIEHTEYESSTDVPKLPGVAMVVKK